MCNFAAFALSLICWLFVVLPACLLLCWFDFCVFLLF